MDISQCREEINNIDDELVKLFQRRMKAAKNVAEYKKENNVPVYDKSRERDIINRILEEVDDDIKGYTKILYSTLFELSRSYQMQTILPVSPIEQKINEAIENTPKLFPRSARVACQGVEGAYSQAACERMFNTPSISFKKKWEDVFKAVETGDCKYGIVPLENSTAGTVNEVYDLLAKYKFYIVRSIKLRINHVLLAKEGTQINDIKVIYSHEQAIRQCSDFLSEFDAEVKVCQNTALASKIVAESDRNDVAAISSPDCSELYGLNTIVNNIMNTDNNYTRLICISKNIEIYPGAHRTSVMFDLPHKPGALHDIISKFRALDINLSKLESRPIPGRDFEFKFYFDMDASVYRPELIRLITEVKNTTEAFTYLGSYTEIF